MSKTVQIPAWGILSKYDPAGNAGSPERIQKDIAKRRGDAGSLLAPVDTSSLPKGVKLAYRLKPLPSLSETIPFSGYRNRRNLWKEDLRKKEVEEAQQEAQRAAASAPTLRNKAKAALTAGPKQLKDIIEAGMKLQSLRLKGIEKQEQQSKQMMGGSRAAGLHFETVHELVKGKKEKQTSRLQERREEVEEVEEDQAFDNQALLDAIENPLDSRQKANLLQTVKAGLKSGLQGVKNEEDPVLIQISKEIKELGWQEEHNDMLEELYSKRQYIKSVKNDSRAELDESDFRLLNLLENERNAHQAQQTHKKSGGGSLLKVNEMDDSEYDEENESSLENNFKPYLESATPYQENVSSYMTDMTFEDPDGGGQCQSCGMMIPSHMDEQFDALTGQSVHICPICNACEHLDWAGLQRAGKMIWAPSIPQSFLSQLTVLVVMTVGVLRDIDLMDKLRDSLFEGDEEKGYTPLSQTKREAILREHGVPAEKAADLVRKNLAKLEAIEERLGITRDQPDGSITIREIAESIKTLYDMLYYADMPLQDFFGGNGSNFDASDPLFYAEQMRAEGFFAQEINSLRKRHAELLKKIGNSSDGYDKLSKEEKKVFRDVGGLARSLLNLDGLRFLPDPAWWAPLIQGPWQGMLNKNFPPEKWKDFVPEIQINVLPSRKKSSKDTGRL